ncbi:MAG TPA: histidine kinase, partial [Flavisolibacter sp.]
VFFFFFMLEMAFSWQDENLYIKIFLLTFLHTLAMWEPTRFLILQLRKTFAGLSQVRRRVRILVSTTVPYAVSVGFLRIFLEDRTNLWGVPTASWSSYSYTIGITLLFILLQIAVYESLYFFSEWHRSNQEAEEMKRLNVQVQLDSLKVQIQPHFLFNTLNTLIGLIEINKSRAISFTQDMAFVYRYLLEANESALIDLEDELTFAYTYFSLLKTRYPEGLELFTDVKEASDFQVPPLCLQILIENAIKHNRVTKAAPLQIRICFDRRRQQVIVQNNHQPKPIKWKSGLGLQHLQKKFALLDLPTVSVQSTQQEFVVSFPVIKRKVYEHCHY